MKTFMDHIVAEAAKQIEIHIGEADICVEFVEDLIACTMTDPRYQTLLGMIEADQDCADFLADIAADLTVAVASSEDFSHFATVEFGESEETKARKLFALRTYVEQSLAALYGLSKLVFKHSTVASGNHS